MKITDAFDPGTGWQIAEDVVVAPGEGWSRKVLKGQHVRFIDLEGKQAVDFLCYDAANPSDRYNAANTIKLGGSIFLGEGSVLWSDRGHRMMSVVKDTCGRHDTIAGCCSSEMNMLRYQKPGPGNCRDTFERALKTFGLQRQDIVSNVNWFMHVPVENDGELVIAEGISKPGDYVEVEAERDVLCVVSNCAQIFNNSNGYNPTPVRIVTFHKTVE
jgi:urea carboxylase-associated protein 1